MKVLLPFVCVVLFVAFTTVDTVGAKEPEPSCPTITFPCHRMRKVCENIRRAIKGGKPTRLHRITDRKAINNNARLAKCARKLCAQYPFAMTREGGKGAFVKPVPRDEIRLQRSLLVQFYRGKNIGNGGCFNVELGEKIKSPTS